VIALPDDLVELSRGRALCFVTTLMPDGSPVTTQTWVDTDGSHLIINTVTTHQKARNIARDPRVSVAIADPDNPSRYWGVRGSVTATTTEGGDDHINALSQRYLGRDYPGFGGGSGSRLIVTIAPARIHAPGW
jgi:PPOX class probable F420-dependent enzyme